MSEPFLIPDSEFASQARGLRALVAALLGRDDAVDDIVQETWLVAMTDPPRDRRNAAGWLRAVARNLSRESRRRERRIRAYEARAACSEQVEPTDATIARTEALRRVVDALHELDEPYRNTLLLRYFDDLEPKEIARRLGMPPATVRTHIHRGLAQLRERLDARCGGREAWVLCVAPVVLTAPTTAASTGGTSAMADVCAGGASAMAKGPAAFGGLTMAASAKSVTAVVCLAVGASLLGLLLLLEAAKSRHGVDRADRGASAAPSDVVADRRDERPADVPAGSGLRAASASRDALASVDTAREAADPDDATGLHEISGRLVEAGSGQSMSGVALVARTPGDSSVIARATTDEAGHFAFPRALARGEFLLLAPDERYGLARPESPSVLLARIEIRDTDITDLLLEHPWTGCVEGRVVDASGTGVPGAQMCVCNDSLEFGGGSFRLAWRSQAVLTDAEGHYRFDRLPTDAPVVVAVQHPDYAVARSEPTMATCDSQVVIRVERGGTVAGVVIDSEGAPIPAAMVRVSRRLGLSEDYPLPASVETDASGRFEIPRCAAGPWDVYAGARGYAFPRIPVAKVEVGDGATSEVTVVLRDGRAASISGVVVDPTGRPVERVIVSATGNGVSEYTDADGRFVLEFPEPPEGHELPKSVRLYLIPHSEDPGVLRAGHRYQAAGEHPMGATDLRLLFDPPRTIFVIEVRDARSDLPIAGADVYLRSDPPGGLDPTVFLHGRRSVLAATDERGEVRVTGIAPGSWLVVATARDRALAREDVSIDARDEERRILLRLEEGMPLRGRVVDRESRGVPTRPVALFFQGEHFASTTATTDANGAFTIFCGPLDPAARIHVVRTNGTGNSLQLPEVTPGELLLRDSDER